MPSAESSQVRRLRSLLEAWAAASRAVEEGLEALGAAYGICASKVRILLDLAAHPGTGLSELCARTGLKKSVASRHLEALVQGDFVVRSPSPADGRALALELSPSLKARGFCSAQGLAQVFPGATKAKATRLDALADALGELEALASARD